MKLVQVRECDGKCCEESPRFPNTEGTHCIYWSSTRAFIGGCKIMRGEANVPDEPSPTNPDHSATETYQQTCANWPENIPGRGTGGCCWQWVDGD